MKQIAQGAEAKILADENTIVKERFQKTYRIPEIDDKLRKIRTRREAKVIEKLKDAGIPVPKLIKSDDKSMTITMQNLNGPRVRDILEKSDYREICEEIGKKIRKMHDAGIIHADLTTSNMIMLDEVYFIDFGLSFFSEKTEDKAVDMHLLKEALKSKHYTMWKDAFDSVLKGYADKEVEARLEKVEARGKYKGKH